MCNHISQIIKLHNSPLTLRQFGTADRILMDNVIVVVHSAPRFCFVPLARVPCNFRCIKFNTSLKYEPEDICMNEKKNCLLIEFYSISTLHRSRFARRRTTPLHFNEISVSLR